MQTTESRPIEVKFKGLHVTKDQDGRLSIELADLPVVAEDDMGSLPDLFAHLGALWEEYGDEKARKLLEAGLLMLGERRCRTFETSESVPRVSGPGTKNQASPFGQWLDTVTEHLEDDIEDALRDNGRPVEPDFVEHTDR